jgi:hypothetical protein
MQDRTCALKQQTASSAPACVCRSQWRVPRLPRWSRRAICTDIRYSKRLTAKCCASSSRQNIPVDSRYGRCLTADRCASSSRQHILMSLVRGTVSTAFRPALLLDSLPRLVPSSFHGSLFDLTRRGRCRLR